MSFVFILQYPRQINENNPPNQHSTPPPTSTARPDLISLLVPFHRVPACLQRKRWRKTGRRRAASPARVLPLPSHTHHIEASYQSAVLVLNEEL